MPLKLSFSSIGSYFGVISFLAITVIVTVYILSRTVLEIYSIFLAAISILMVIGLFAVFVPYSFSFHLCLFSSVIFPAFSLSVWSVQRTAPYNLIVSVISPFAGIIPLIVHRYTYNKDLTIPPVQVGTWTVFLFFSFSAVLFASIPQLTPQMTIDTIFFSGLTAFTCISVQITNMTFRIKILNDKLQMKNRIRKVETYGSLLEKKSQYHKDQIAFILFYLNQSLEDFTVGDFERSFENSFKILFDEHKGNYIFADVHTIQKYESRRMVYAPIRNSLVHAKAHSGKIQKTEDLKRIRKGLYENALTLLRIVKSEYMDVISS